MSGIQRPRPTPADQAASDQKSCPKCGSQVFREVAQTTYAAYFACEQCGHLITVGRPGVDHPSKE
jgi:uncharacterized Zn finger protein